LAYSIDLYEASEDSAQSIGNKAASLVQLHRAGFRVPRGVCITTEAFRAWRTGGGVSAQLKASLFEAYGKLSGPLAVRSSSPAEDREDASFAGQYATLLGIRTVDALIAAVEECWRSASSSASIAYRRDHEDAGDVEMAVLIQELVNATAAGVMFTMNPVSDRVDEIVINANFGLGDSVVSGRAEPDTFVLDKGSAKTIDTRLGTKRVVTRQGSERAEEFKLDEIEREKFSLNDRQLRELWDAAKRLEAHFDAPVDSEWAFIDDTLYMLQARPVTTGMAAYYSSLLDTWARDRGLINDRNAVWSRGSVLSGLRVSPLYYSEMSAFFADLFADIARLHDSPPGKEQLFRYYNGFTYTNAAFYSTSDPPGAVRPEGPLSKIWRSNLKIALRHPRTLAFWCNIDYYNAKWQKEWLPGIRKQRPDFATATCGQIREFIEYLETQRRERSIVAGLAVGYAPNLLGLLMYLLHRWLPEAPGETLGVLTSGLPDSLTHAENAELWILSQKAGALPEVRSAVIVGRIESIDSVVSGREYLAKVDGFRARHAHRGSSDRDIFQARWGDDRAILLRQVGVMLGLGQNADPEAAHKRAAHRRVETEQEILGSLKQKRFGAIKRRLFLRVLRSAQRYTIHRDNQRHTFEPYFLELRHAYRAIGAQFAAKGALTQQDDIFFLAKDEIYAYIDAKLSGASVMRRAMWRKGWWYQVTKTEPPAFIRGNQPYVPDAAPMSTKSDLEGSGGAPGVVTGTVRLIDSLQQLSLIKPGEILVTHAIDPAWTPVFGIIGGVISVEGGMLAHAAVLGREYGLPVVVGAAQATARLKDGDVVQINGTTGAVVIVSAAAVMAQPEENEAKHSA
jgi:phosphohistidine swiveling domain-containing protein